jgi:hypothetical protein
VLLEKTNTLISYLQGHDWLVEPNDVKRSLRLLLKFNLELKLFMCGKDECEPVGINCDFSEIKELNVKMKVNKIGKGSSKSCCKHITIVNPLINDYSIFINLSQPYSCFNYGYNYLHLYEHLMTSCWKECDKSDLVLMNGYTTIDARCMVFAVVKTERAFKEYLEALNNFTANDLIDDDTLKLETNRTVSETLVDKSLCCFGRTNPGGYDKNVLLKLFDQGFNVVTVTPNVVKGCKFAAKTVNKNKVNSKGNTVDDTKLTVPTFDYLPLSVLRDKYNRPFHVLSVNEDVTSHILSSGLVGIPVTYNLVEDILRLGLTDEVLVKLMSYSSGVSLVE